MKNSFFPFFLDSLCMFIVRLKKKPVTEEERKLLGSVISVYVKLLYKHFLVGSTSLCVFWHRAENANAWSIQNKPFRHADRSRR